MNNLVPQEALNWFSSKGLKPAFSYEDVWREEHSKAFTVAKAMQLDVLSDIKTAVEDALKDGKTFQQFRQTLTPVLQSKGWWGRKELTDPLDGRPKEAQLGSARRLQLIYRTNMRTARAAGQWDRIQRTKDTLPFLRYGLGPSEQHRPEHAALEGLILPADDPFWSTHYPPNGWGCKCRVRQISAAEANRSGGVGIAPPITTREYINRRTGEATRVPNGIDPGWDYNPGAARNQPMKYFSQKLDLAPIALAKPVLADFVRSQAFHHWYLNPQGQVPIAVMPDHHMASMGAKTHTVQLSQQTLGKQQRHHPDIQESDYRRVQDVLDKGWSLQDGPQNRIYVWETAGYVTVIKATTTGKAVFMTSLRRLSKAQSKRDKELQRLRKKAGK